MVEQETQMGEGEISLSRSVIFITLGSRYPSLPEFGP